MRFLMLLLVVVLSLFAPVVMLAADTITPAPAALDVNTIVQGVIVALLPVMVYYIRLLIPKMPRMLVWTLPLVLSGLLSTITNVMQTTTLTPTQVVVMGALALMLREGYNTFKEHGLK